MQHLFHISAGKTGCDPKKMVPSIVSTMTLVPFTLIKVNGRSVKLSSSINKTFLLVIFVFDSKL